MLTNSSRQISRQVRRSLQRGTAHVPGFTPVENRRVSRMVRAAVLDMLALGHEPARAEGEAVRAVCRELPPLTASRRHRAPRASRGDSAAWRKSGADIECAAYV